MKLLAIFSTVVVLLFDASIVRAACSPPGELKETSNRKLSDPFKFNDGHRVATKAEWACRRVEIAQKLQQYELGDLAPRPSVLKASLANSTLTINIQEGAKTISFDVKIQLPTRGSGPFPLVITYTATTIPLPSDVAVIIYPNDQIAGYGSQNLRGRGKFYDLHGAKHTAGGLIAQAWGLSRIIDALEMVGSSVTKIDTTRIAVTGCSRNGAGALVAGAFDERIALTIPQESGPGGPMIWRLYYDTNHCIPPNKCPQVQLPPFWENTVAFREGFPSAGYNFDALPYDNHELLGLIAQRGLLVIENEIDWLNPPGTYVGSKAARLIYEALGEKKKMGYSMRGNHQHCSFPNSQIPELTAFFDKFLRRKEADTDVFISSVNVTASYIDWNVPDLS